MFASAGLCTCPCLQFRSRFRSLLASIGFVHNELISSKNKVLRKTSLSQVAKFLKKLYPGLLEIKLTELCIFFFGLFGYERGAVLSPLLQQILESCSFMLTVSKRKICLCIPSFFNHNARSYCQAASSSLSYLPKLT